MSSIRIVVTCSDRKRERPRDRLRLRSVGSRGPLESRAAHWVDRLKHESAPTRQAADLYSGEHWAAVLALVETARSKDFSPDLWVCSAGYGLVRSDAQLKPYAATFARGHEDSVERGVTSSESPRLWWRAIAQWEGPQPREARLVADLAAAHPRTPLILVASPAYLRAIADDALAAGAILGDRFYIVSAGSKTTKALRSFLVPADARFQHRLGGSKVGLNARVASLLLRESHGVLEREVIFSKLRSMSNHLPRPTVYNRVPMTDEQVTRWIEGALKERPDLSATAALVLLRSQGRACEQKRFGNLFHGRGGKFVGR